MMALEDVGGSMCEKRHSAMLLERSAPEGEADEIGQIADIHAGHRFFGSPAAKISK